MTVHYRIDEQSIVVFGNTYPHKDRIKALGARFNGVDKTWILANSEEILEKVAELCSSVGGGSLGQASPVNPKQSLKLTSESKSLEVDLPKDSVTVADLMLQLNAALTSAFPIPLWIVGEIQNISKKPSAIFLSIAEPKKDADHSSTVSIKATIWRSKLNEIIAHRGGDIEDLLLVDGTQIRLLAQVQLYRDRGHVSLNILDLDPNFTKGALALAREKLLRELRQKGLDVANRTLSLTPFPLRVGLISADGSRAYSDFMDQLREYKYPGEVVFVAAQMQGEKVPDHVSAAITKLEKMQCDVIVLTRGGGSAADLRWFDDRKIAYAIAEARVPIVAAIGHHDDVCVAEEICYMRQKTPTAAADYIVHQIELTKRKIEESALEIAHFLQRKVDGLEALQNRLPEVLQRSVERRLSLESERVDKLVHNIVHASTSKFHNALLALSKLKEVTYQAFNHRIRKYADHLKATQFKILTELDRFIKVKNEGLLKVEFNVRSLDPKPWLAKGWTKFVFDGGRSVRSASDVSVGELGKAIMIDGDITVKIEKIEMRT